MSGQVLFVARPGERTRSQVAFVTLVAVVALIGTLFVGQPVEAEERVVVEEAEALLVDLVNAERAGVGDADVGPLEVVHDLTSQARDWANHLADTGQVTHNQDAGLDACCWVTFAESVIAADADADPAAHEPTTRAIFRQLMASSGNRANLLRSHVDHIGVGVVHQSSGRLWVTIYVRQWDGTELPPEEPDDPETPTDEPSDDPSDDASDEPSVDPTDDGSEEPSDNESDGPEEPSDDPTDGDSEEPSEDPSTDQSEPPTDDPTDPEPDDDPSGDSSHPPTDANDDGLDDQGVAGDQQSTPRQRASGPVIRLAGDTREGTAVQISSHVFDSADTVLIARSMDFADALTGAPLAIAQDAPLLLNPTDVGVKGDGFGLRLEVRHELERLSPSTVILLGGTGALGHDVEYEAANITGARVVRLAGHDRAATATRIARLMMGESPSIHAYLVEGRLGWADAVSVAAPAGWRGSPVLLTGSQEVPPATMDFLTDWNVSKVTIVGGVATVSSKVAEQLAAVGISVDRIGGRDRYDTSALVADHGLGLGMSPDAVWLSTGRDFPDALAAAAGAGAKGSGVLLVDGASPSRGAQAMAWLRDHQEKLAQILITGGTRAVSDDVVDAARRAARV